MDKTMIVWLPHLQENGVWMEHARMGEVLLNTTEKYF